jgi:hypothetical protein
MNGVENQSGGVMGEVLIAPLEQVIAQIGQEIAQAQGAIDVGSMTTQRNIEGNPSLKDLGIEAPWYHMAEVELDLKMTLTLKSEQTAGGGSEAHVLPHVWAAPFNASYQNNFNTDASGTSRIRIKIVSVPPPHKGG